MTTQNDPLAIYRIGKKGTPLSVKAPNPFEQENEQDPLATYRIKAPENKYDYTAKDFVRIPSALAARSGEITIGYPEETKRGIGSLLDLIIGVPTEYFTGKTQPKLREFLRDPMSSLGEHREDIEQIERTSLSPAEASVFTKYPTSEEIRESITKPASEALTGQKDILEPKTEKERFAQEVTQDLTRLALPGSGIHSWFGRAGLAFAGNSSKELAKQLGFTPSMQELAKFGTLGVLSLASIGNAPKFAKDLFQSTKAMMPRGVRFRTTALENALNRIKQTDWYKGHATPSTAAARDLIKSIEKAINNGSLSAHEAMTFRENVNELAGAYGAFNVGGSARKTHVSRLNEVRDALIEGMEQTLGRQYPNWWKKYQDANVAYGVTQRSNAIGQFLANNYGKPIFSESGKLLFGSALAKGAAGIGLVGTSAASIATGAKAITLMNRVMESPVLRRYYQRVVNAAVKSDGIAMANALRKFDEEALKEEKIEKAKRPLRKVTTY